MIGTAESLLGTIHSVGLRNLSVAELPNQTPPVVDWDDPQDWSDLFSYRRFYPEGSNDQERVSMTRMKMPNSHFVCMFYCWARGDEFLDTINRICYMYEGGLTADIQRLYSGFREAFELQLTVGQATLRDKYFRPRKNLMPYGEIFRRIASVDGSALGLWAFPDFRGYMSEIEQSDQENHGVHFSRILIPSDDPGYVIGSKACHPLLSVMTYLDEPDSLKPVARFTTSTGWKTGIMSEADRGLVA